MRKRKAGPSTNDSAYFCHVRFLCRLDFKRFRRLCLFIFKRRFFFRLPIGGGATVRAARHAVQPNLFFVRRHRHPPWAAGEHEFARHGRNRETGQNRDGAPIEIQLRRMAPDRPLIGICID